MKQPSTNYIRSSKVTLKFTNTKKRKQINKFIDDYMSLTTQFVDILWEMEKIPSLLDKEITDQIQNSHLSARIVQSAGKQASGIVRGTIQKQKKRKFTINKLNSQGKFKQARKLV